MAEMIKFVAHVVAIKLANVCCRNTEGDSKACKSYKSQNQGVIVPAIANSRYKDFLEPNGAIVEI
jgi:hypothetical protein